MSHAALSNMAERLRARLQDCVLTLPIAFCLWKEVDSYSSNVVCNNTNFSLNQDLKTDSHPG